YAVRAAEDKQARDIRILDLREITSFADQFVICTGSNSRQIQSIADEIEVRLKKLGERAISIEGYENAEWVLMDYGDYLIHVFSEAASPLALSVASNGFSGACDSLSMLASAVPDSTGPPPAERPLPGSLRGWDVPMPPQMGPLLSVPSPVNCFPCLTTIAPRPA